MKRHWLLATLSWSFVAALYTAQLLYMTRRPGETIPFWPAFTANLSYYLSWIPLTVPVWAISRGWLLDEMRPLAFTIRHLSLAIVVVFTHTVLSLLVAGVFMPALRTWMTFIGQLRGRVVSGLLVYVAIAGAGMALSYYARWRERELAAAQFEAQLSEARLQTLKAQLHPHFLFNTLHAVASLVRTGNKAGAIKAISDLSDLLRRVLDADARTLVPLLEEAGFLERYFDIQRMRFGDRLQTSIVLEPGTQAILVPAMVLQPLVENAFRHGLSDRLEAGQISVRATRRSGGSVEIVIEDDGQGLPAGWTMQAHQGVGLKNTSARLAHAYGDDYDFRVEPRLGGGTKATIRLS